MTLLLGGMSRHGLAMSSDGLCRRLSRSGQAAALAEELQKIFPFEAIHWPIAIAHHGQNLLNGRPIKEIIAELELDSKGLLSIEAIADLIRLSLNAAVRKTLERLKAEGITDGCGFWVGGYGSEKEQPCLCEVFWGQRGGPAEFHSMGIGLHEGGDGKSFSRAARQQKRAFDFTEEDARTWSPAQWGAYLERLYKAARNQPGADKIFGGKVWKLWIEKTGCRWVKQ